jgi:hypothetical protein
MRISLTSPVRKAAFLSGCTTAGLLAWALCWQAFAEHWVARAGTVEGYKRAARIQSLNADYPRALGTDLIHTNVAEAILTLQASARINPHSAHTWLALSRAYGVVGPTENQHQAIMEALAADPKDVDVEWDASMFLIQNGDVDGGLKLVRDVISNDRSKEVAGIQTAYRATGGDVERTLAAVPPTAPARLNFMRWLLDHDDASAADRVWPTVAEAEGKLQARDLFFYMDSLITRGQTERAKSVWATLLTRDPGIQRRMEPGNLLVNGDFEDNLLNGGFCWHYTKTDGVSVTVDTSTFHGGTRALALQFDGDGISDAGIYELVPVKPGTRYALRGFTHSEELESANGARLVVTDYYANKNLMLGEEIFGSTSWRETSGEFTTGPETRMLKVSVVRAPSFGRVRGTLWLDDLRLEPRP